MLGWFKKSPPQPPGSGPDYSDVDSMDKAKALARDGKLTKLLLHPAQFGGEDVPNNIVYVPPFVAERKDAIEANIVAPLIREGKVSMYAVTPAYQGRSVVPSAIGICASQPGDFTATIGVWGKALTRQG